MGAFLMQSFGGLMSLLSLLCDDCSERFSVVLTKESHKKSCFLHTDFSK